MASYLDFTSFHSRQQQSRIKNEKKNTTKSVENEREKGKATTQARFINNFAVIKKMKGKKGDEEETVKRGQKEADLCSDIIHLEGTKFQQKKK